MRELLKLPADIRTQVEDLAARIQAEERPRPIFLLVLLALYFCFHDFGAAASEAVRRLERR